MLRFIEYILESLDKPWNLQQLDKNHPFHQDVKNVANKDYPDHSKLKVYKATDDNDNNHGHVLEFVNKGAIEIHHLDKDNVSGIMNPSANKPNPKFIATMKSRIDHHTNKGYPVRIIGANEMINKYHKLSKKVYNKTKHITDLKDYEHPGYSNTKSFTISPPKLFELNSKV